MQTLADFMKGKAGLARNSHVFIPGFAVSYVRYTRRYLVGAMREPVLDLARIEAKAPGEGAFTRLLGYMRRCWPEVWLYVECVQSDRFARKLLALGFIKEDRLLN